MKFSFLGYSVEGIMEFNLDLKDVAILRYFDDFRKSGKMNCEVIGGEEYYWISYQGIERELPFLNLSKRSISKRVTSCLSKPPGGRRTMKHTKNSLVLFCFVLNILNKIVCSC